MCLVGKGCSLKDTKRIISNNYDLPQTLVKLNHQSDTVASCFLHAGASGCASVDIPYPRTESKGLQGNLYFNT